MFKRENLILLRVHFSLFLLPVFLFALSQTSQFDVRKAWLLFFILHFLVYTSSNGYNSYMDRDTSPIGGLKNPPMAGKELFYLTVLLDIIAILLSFLIRPFTSLLVAVYILASRAYSYRGIRLKKYPILGFLTVTIFQGGFTYFNTYYSLALNFILEDHLFAILASSLLIGGIYPLTQIYQHEADLKDGVVTISYKLGYIGTFILCAVCFVLAMVCMFLHFHHQHQISSFVVMQLFLLPVVLFFIFWFCKVYTDSSNANFENTMKMNLIASLSLNLCFTYLLVGT